MLKLIFLIGSIALVSAFTTGSDYELFNLKESSSVFTAGNENYVRAKCKTCCRVIFASDYNYVTESRFTDANDRDGHTRYVMDMEFDDKNKVRIASGEYEQCILVRPLKQGNELQYWEFAPYKMYISFPIPKRVHDIRGSADPNNKLIIWQKKPPLDDGTKNQRFVYIHPYKDYTGKGSQYKQHFFIPFRTDIDLCYQVLGRQDSKQTWKGNENLVFKNMYQIKAEYCSTTEPKQIFVPVFA